MVLDVLAVVVTYNSEDLVDELLDTVPTAMGDLTHEVVIVDNGSADRTVEKLRARGAVHVVEQENHGYAAGINAGAAARPDSESILVLNPDVRLQPGSVVTMLERLRSSGAGVVAPRMLGDSGELSMSLRREPTLLRAAGLTFVRSPLFSEYVQEPREYQEAHIADWAVGAVMLVSRECHDALGGWDASYFLYSEETDLCLRAAARGWPTFYEPRAVVVHIGGASGRNPRTHSMQILNRVRLYARRNPRPKAWAYWLLTVASELSWLARGQVESRASVRALLRPSTRPAELGLGRTVLPR